MQQSLLIEIRPSYSDMARSLGYDNEGEEINADHVLIEQGSNTDFREIKPGERFKIDTDKMEAQIKTNGNKYKPLCKFEYESFFDSFYESDDIITLKSGEYLFHEDGITIEFLNFLQYDKEEDNSF
jgi:glutamine phosphoribosylpyrophosphate amidotransferase